MLYIRRTEVMPYVCMLGQVEEPLRAAISTGMAGVISKSVAVFIPLLK